MLTEKTRNKALEDFLKGRKVVVMTVFDDGSIAAEKLEDILMTEDVHFLVDVPAVEDMEFKQAVADMVRPDQKLEEPAEEKSVTPPSKRPEVSDVLPAGKTKKEIALQLAEQGMKIPEIAKKIDAKYSTVYNWLNPEKCKTKKKDEKTALDYKNPDARPGWNADRKKCKTCKFRPATALKSNGAGCDYLDLIGHSRGCAVEDCDRYVKGVRMERKRK